MQRAQRCTTGSHTKRLKLKLYRLPRHRPRLPRRRRGPSTRLLRSRRPLRLTFNREGTRRCSRRTSRHTSSHPSNSRFTSSHPSSSSSSSNSNLVRRHPRRSRSNRQDRVLRHLHSLSHSLPRPLRPLHPWSLKHLSRLQHLWELLETTFPQRSLERLRRRQSSTTRWLELWKRHRPPCLRRKRLWRMFLSGPAAASRLLTQ
mmetsp:Transcript_2222/g.6335  ORF Transcript_2222/g.6335 Transcript_2222/m.6335 type:complete len:202 (+) Transcript_2222:1089-1694(+)